MDYTLPCVAGTVSVVPKYLPVVINTLAAERPLPTSHCIDTDKLDLPRILQRRFNFQNKWFYCSEIVSKPIMLLGNARVLLWAGHPPFPYITSRFIYEFIITDLTINLETSPKKLKTQHQED